MIRDREREKVCTRTEIDISSTVSPLRDASILGPINGPNFHLPKKLIKRVNFWTLAAVSL